jgi:hypothetical protein
MLGRGLLTNPGMVCDILNNTKLEKNLLKDFHDKLYEEIKSEFNYIASKVFDDFNLRAVKNEYGSESYNGCWFIIKTDNGDIKIGWRKRVIQIEWLDNYKKFRFNGENEDVTKEFSSKERYIHAWNTEKAINYLRQAKRTIIK